MFGFFLFGMEIISIAQYSISWFEAVALDLHGNKEVLAIHKAEDVAKLLKEKTNLSYDITVHKQEQTDEIKQSIGKLSSELAGYPYGISAIEGETSLKSQCDRYARPFFWCQISWCRMAHMNGG